MIWTTSLEVSRTLKEMGVELESGLFWCDGETDEGHKTYLDISTQFKRELPISSDIVSFDWLHTDVEFPAYTLDQMYKVLEQVGKVKGWKKGVRCGCLYDNPSLCCHGKKNYTCTWCVEGNPNRRKETYDWQHHYLRLCEAVPLGKGDEVLKDILKHV